MPTTLRGTSVFPDTGPWITDSDNPNRHPRRDAAPSTFPAVCGGGGFWPAAVSTVESVTCFRLDCVRQRGCYWPVAEVCLIAESMTALCAKADLGHFSSILSADGPIWRTLAREIASVHLCREIICQTATNSDSCTHGQERC